jgi:hypothetical protein
MRKRGEEKKMRDAVVTIKKIMISAAQSATLYEVWTSRRVTDDDAPGQHPKLRLPPRSSRYSMIRPILTI